MTDKINPTTLPHVDTKPEYNNGFLSEVSQTGGNLNSTTKEKRVHPPAKEQTRPTSSSHNSEASKSHKVEGKNKKSLSQKQQQRSPQQSQPKQQQQTQQQLNLSSNRQRATNQKNQNNSSKSPSSSNESQESPSGICSTLDEFSRRSKELKEDICRALEKQEGHQIIDQPVEVVKLKEEILKLSGLSSSGTNSSETINGDDSTNKKSLASESQSVQLKIAEEENSGGDNKSDNDIESKSNTNDMRHNKTRTSEKLYDGSHNHSSLSSQEKCNIAVTHNDTSQLKSSDRQARVEDNNDSVGYKSDSILTLALDKLSVDSGNSGVDPKKSNNNQAIKTLKSSSKKPTEVLSEQQTVSAIKTNDTMSDVFEPLNAKLDFDSKVIALKSSLQKHFLEAPHLLEPICYKLAYMSDQNGQLSINCENIQSENQKLMLIKQKLENLCRELQKSNNAIRIESLDLIKLEQSKAKEQTTKIQSTLSGVIKLFDENQQRNMSLRQENQELQTKLKSLLDHCDNWEKSVETALRQRDIENRLLKTELAKANLIKNEDKEKFLSEKQELLQILSMMQEQRNRIEGQEAKLRSDLSSYASKYDECQAVISKGMSRFQTESKRMLKQIEKSKQDYKVLLTKYESSNRRITQLLEEKQHWDKAMGVANKKIETLEKLCRALRESKEANNSSNLSTKHQPKGRQDEGIIHQFKGSDKNASLAGQINGEKNEKEIMTCCPQKKKEGDSINLSSCDKQENETTNGDESVVIIADSQESSNDKE